MTDESKDPQEPVPGDIETPAEMEFVESDAGLVVLYSNVAQVSVSAEDVGLTFGVRDTDDPLIVRQGVRVYLSLPHAKRLASVIGGGIERLEGLIGPIDANPARTAKRAKEKKEKEEADAE